ncbi:FliM/FliN family flagellar motor switch protein [Colwellia sp. MEBiC06753]
MISNIQEIELSKVEEQKQEGSAVKPQFAFVKNVEVALVAKIGGRILTIEELYQLKMGEIVSLDTDVDQSVALCVEDTVVAEGRLVAQDGKYALQVTHLNTLEL